MKNKKLGIKNREVPELPLSDVPYIVVNWWKKAIVGKSQVRREALTEHERPLYE